MTDAPAAGADGRRFYEWAGGDTPLNRKYNAMLPMTLLSVSTIRKVCGEPMNLVSWQLANMADVSLGTQKRMKVGPRGGISYPRTVFEFPSEFAVAYMASEGKQEVIDELRKSLRAQADEPRNIAARRGSIVHAAIEQGVKADRIERPYVEKEFARLSERDRKRAKAQVTDEDIAFVSNAMRQYEDMRAKVPFVVLARETRVVNVTAGYAGTADVLLWFLPEGTDLAIVKAWQQQADRGNVSIGDIRATGGWVCLGDWKTSEDLHTDNVTQCTAYTIAEFVANRDGTIDERLSDILAAITTTAVIHIRPNKWSVNFVELNDDVIRAFLGSVAFARFLASHPEPDSLFTSTIAGEADTREDVTA